MQEASIFMTNKSQAVRLPTNVRFADSVKKVMVRVIGNERILTPIDQTWDSFFFSDNHASEDFMTERESSIQPERESF
ncbi:type II toxin-antitoxin system VapB family antitoxin [Rodentibacter caecimuris]|uniref:Antitoxin n=1 Tax=Rodentibacter caecimuris TaxID=1796644 RepID=A0AAJ3MYE7_9PAST|nr:type II toxin-antitoxin system VapB family antitoxin [Rodentibacter heylii]MCX2961013.1 antitoxin [Rodentibacter heylii]OOF70557.1 antitoxin [Rodentibacter heylii]OOF77172.1 antitoxin [Rodentibacter heylii]